MPFDCANVARCFAGIACNRNENRINNHMVRRRTNRSLPASVEERNRSEATNSIKDHGGCLGPDGRRRLRGLAPGALAAGTPSLATLSSHGGAQRIANTPAAGKAKNVILFIGDGMGDSEITVARDYLYGPGGTLEGIDKIGQADATSAKTLGLASSTEEINALSSGAKVSVKDGVAQVTGFDGDAVLGYQLQDTETGTVLAASNDDTPVSGVRVDTGTTTTIDFNGVKGFDPSASTYTLTATGKQSGTKIATEFGLTGNGASNVVIAPKTGDKAADNAKQAGLGGALVGALGTTGTRILGTVMVALALAVAGALLAAWRRGLFARK